jgi:predicted nicotinamide N-methyase
MVNLTERPTADPSHVLLGDLLDPGAATLDGLRLTAVPFVPGVHLHLASDAVILEARLVAERGQGIAPPLWASVWAGGQALARHITEHPEIVAGRTVLDVASGSGIVAIAAAVAGAARVTANDIDPYALAAIALNARSNGVAVTARPGDLLDGDGEGAEVILAGDVFYGESMASRMSRFLERAADRGGHVLVGDPGRACLPRRRFEFVASYPLLMTGAGQDAQVSHASVWQPRRRTC